MWAFGPTLMALRWFNPVAASADEKREALPLWRPRSMSTTSPILVVIPALNEEASLPLVLDDLASLPVHIAEVIVVDNGSSDQTAEVARRRGATVLAESQRGYGAACLRALRHIETSHASIDLSNATIVFIDGDHSDHAEDLPLLLEPIAQGRADFVVGSRVCDSSARAAVPLPSRVGNAFACAILRVLYRQRFTDLGPFRAITWPALQQLHMTDRTWGWTIEMQLRACQEGLDMAERAVRYRHRHAGTSKISGSLVGGVRAATKILWVIARHLLRPPLSLPAGSTQP